MDIIEETKNGLSNKVKRDSVNKDITGINRFNIVFQGDENDIETKKKEIEKMNVNEMTSRDYYFDSYAHFGIHEGLFPYILTANSIIKL